MDKEHLKLDLIRFGVYALFLSLFFCALVTYQGLLLKEYEISYFHYGYAIFQSAILSKMILLGEALGIGERWKDKPLIYPVLYRTIAFTLFVFALFVLEHFLHGLFHGKPFARLYNEVLETGIYVISAKAFVTSFVLFLLFIFAAISKQMGEAKLFSLFFRSR